MYVDKKKKSRTCTYGYPVANNRYVDISEGISLC
jgi:hypothetical protein